MTRFLRTVYALYAFTICSVPAHAQDQVEIIDSVFTPLTSAIPANPRQLTYAEAKALIDATLQSRYPSTPKLVDDPNFYCIIHAVVWKQPSASSDKPEIDLKKWYVFRGGPQWGQLQMEGTRIYGSHKVAVLALHWTQSVVLPTDAEISTLARGDATAITSMRTELAHGPISRFVDSNGKTLDVKDGVVYVRGYPPATPVTYRVEITQKTPAPWADLLQLLAGVTQSAAQKLQNRVQPIWSGRVMNVQYVPSDILVRMLFDVTLTELDKNTYDDEGLYRWDVSAGFPVRAIKQLQYDTTSGTATPKVVDKYNVYGLVNFFLKPVDVKTHFPIWPPSIVAGVGVTGRPWERPMIGLGFGFNKVSTFIGGAWSRVKDPAGTSSTGMVNLKTHWDPHPKLVFGINLTAKQVTDLLKPKK